MTVEELNLKTGDIVLFSTPFEITKPLTLVSLAIRKIAKTKYNHVGVVVKNWGVPFINEAIENGVLSHEAYDRLNKFKGDVKVIRPISGLFVEKDLAFESNSQIGVKKYDFVGLWYQLWYQISKGKLWIGDGVNNSDKRFYCYEYVAWVYRFIFPYWWKINPSEIIECSEFSTIYEGKINN